MAPLASPVSACNKFFPKNSILQITSCIFFKCAELNSSKIEFYVASFNQKSHISNFHHGTKYMELKCKEIEFFAELNFTKIEF